MPTKAQLLDVLDWSYQEKLDFLDSLTPAEREAVGEVDAWAAKDLMAHCVYWESRMMDNLARIERGEGPQPAADDIDHENARIFYDLRDLSWDALREMVVTTQGRIRDYITATPDAVLNGSEKSPWRDDRTIWQGILGNSVSHTLLHVAQWHGEHGRREVATRMQETMAQRMIALDDSPRLRGVTLYNLACYYSLAGDKDKAIAQLTEALAHAPELVEWSKRDPDFSSIRDDAEFQAIYSTLA
jgi:hypothetical protein